MRSSKAKLRNGEQFTIDNIGRVLVWRGKWVVVGRVNR